MAKSNWARDGLADLHRQGFMRAAFAAPKKPKAKPLPPAGCNLCQDWHEPGKHRYVVWAVTGDTPLSDGKPFVDLKSAKHAAEMRAGTTGIDQAVSLGYDPTNSKFKIVKRYEGTRLARNAAQPVPGDRYDDFGLVWEVVRVRRRDVDARRPVPDPFGKISYAWRTFHVIDLQAMRKV